MEVTFFYGDEQPLEKGTGVELLGDGKVLATDVVGDGGVVRFDAGTEGLKTLAVRVANPPAASDDKKA